MEGLILNMLKSMGFNPEEVKQNINQAGQALKTVVEQLNRIEHNQKKIAEKLDIKLTETVQLPANPEKTH